MKTKSYATRSGLKAARDPAATPPIFPSSSRREATREEIMSRAQVIWEQRGRPSGQDDEIWLEAERQLGARPLRPGALAGSELGANEDAEDAAKVEERLDEIGEPTEPRSPTSV